MNRRRPIHCLTLLLVTLGLLLPATANAAEPRVRYDIEVGVSSTDEATARAGIELARSYTEELFGAELEDNLVIEVVDGDDPSNPYVVAAAGGDDIVVYTGSIGWTSLTPALQMQVIVHEYTHILQRDAFGYDEDVSPMWLIEGMAELVGYGALQSIGVLDDRAVDGEQRRIVAFADELLPPLAEIADIDDFQSSDAPIYPLSYLAVRELIGDPEDGRLQEYLELVDDGTPWRRAFPRAFDTSLRDFYNDFQAWLDDDLTAPRRQAAAFRLPDPEKRAADVTIDEAPGAVESAEQFVVLADTEPDTVCRFDLDTEEGVRLATLRTHSDATGLVFWLQTLPAGVEDAVRVTANCGGQRDRVTIDVES